MNLARPIAAPNLAYLILAIAFIIGIPGTANALEISVIGPSEITVAPGELFTIDLAITNQSETATFGTEVTLYGLTAADATPIFGRTAQAHLVTGCIPSTCFGGVLTADNAFYDPDDLLHNYTEGDGANDPDSIRLALTFPSNVTVPAGGSGALDPGIDGSLDEPSARDVTLDLIAQAIGTHVFTISGIYIRADLQTPLPSFQQNTTFTVHVTDRPSNPVPEPSAALLFTLGTLLATTTIKRRH